MNSFLEQEPEQSLTGEIDFYFEKCEKEKTAPTITGLTLHLGLTDKRELINYKGKHERIIKRALLRLEMVIEEKLYTADFDASSYLIACFFAQWCKSENKSPLLIADLIIRANKDKERK